MIEFPVRQTIAAQLDASAVRAKALAAGIHSMRYEYRERDGTMRCDREVVEIVAEALVELGERAADRETRVGAVLAAKHALDALNRGLAGTTP